MLVGSPGTYNLLYILYLEACNLFDSGRAVTWSTKYAAGH